VGDHGCEYMTRGTVVVLGRTGLNFAAGMSGGLAFVYDKLDTLPKRYNSQMVTLERLTNDDEAESLRKLISDHASSTGSPHAQRILEQWRESVKLFWKVVPNAPTPDAPKPVYRYEPVQVFAEHEAALG